MRQVDRIKLFVLILAVGAVLFHMARGVRALTPPPSPSPSTVPPAPATSLSLTSSPPPPLPSPSPPPASSPSPSTDDACLTKEATEYDGDVVMWGPHNVVTTPAACCAKCREHHDKEAKGCNVWVFCNSALGCAGQKFGECWGKRRAAGEMLPRVRGKGEGVRWVSGAIMSAAEVTAMHEAEQAAARAMNERRERAGNPKVYFDVSTVYSGAAPPDGPGVHGGRIEFVLYATESPRAAENFKRMCTGEQGAPYTFAGMKFYRIIDMFIDQAGSHGAGGALGAGSFDDDPGGLKLRHDRGGLLSAANSGPDSNSGHFSIVVGARHTHAHTHTWAQAHTSGVHALSHVVTALSRQRRRRIWTGDTPSLARWCRVWTW